MPKHHDEQDGRCHFPQLDEQGIWLSEVAGARAPGRIRSKGDPAKAKAT
jgi:hypothetical protein